MELENVTTNANLEIPSNNSNLVKISSKSITLDLEGFTSCKEYKLIGSLIFLFNRQCEV